MEEFDPLTNPGKIFTDRYDQDKRFKSPGEYFNYVNESTNYGGYTFPSANAFGFGDSSQYDTFGEANIFNALTSGFIPLENLFG